MPAEVYPSTGAWTFRQIEGSSRKTLILDGYNAPFGRPRKDPVIKEMIKSRVQTTYYPGNSNGPTRTSFGTNWEPVELKGRWMTKETLKNGQVANQVADAWTAFVRDERLCRISWGVIVSYQGYIEELELARESANEIAWRMKIQIDRRDEVDRKKNRPVVSSVDDDFADLDKFLKNSKKMQEKVFPDMAFDFLDAFDQIAALANAPSAALNRLVGDMLDSKRRTLSVIQHFRASVSGLRTALIGIRELVLNSPIDAVIPVRSQRNDYAWWNYQTDFDIESMLALETLSRMDRKAELDARSQVSKVIVAKEGDTWETLATRSLGDPTRAADIRSLNGATYGEQPTPSEVYVVPA